VPGRCLSKLLVERTSPSRIRFKSKRGLGGRPDWTVYSQIRFPLGDAPAFVNSQSFMNWGDCNHTGRSSHGRTKGAPYHCRVNDLPLVFEYDPASFVLTIFGRIRAGTAYGNTEVANRFRGMFFAF